MNDSGELDGEMTSEQKAQVSMLTADQIQAIDQALMSNIVSNWRKVARVVGTAMGQQSDRIPGIPDLYYSERVRELVLRGVVEAQGNLAAMRYSEVRLPAEVSV